MAARKARNAAQLVPVDQHASIPNCLTSLEKLFWSPLNTCSLNASLHSLLSQHGTTAETVTQATQWRAPKPGEGPTRRRGTQLCPLVATQHCGAAHCAPPTPAMGDVADPRLFVRGSALARARCTPAFAAASIRQLLGGQVRRRPP